MFIQIPGHAPLKCRVVCRLVYSIKRLEPDDSPTLERRGTMTPGHLNMLLIMPIEQLATAYNEGLVPQNRFIYYALPRYRLFKVFKDRGALVLPAVGFDPHGLHLLGFSNHRSRLIGKILFQAQPDGDVGSS